MANQGDRSEVRRSRGWAGVAFTAVILVAGLSTTLRADDDKSHESADKEPAPLSASPASWDIGEVPRAEKREKTFLIDARDRKKTDIREVITSSPSLRATLREDSKRAGTWLLDLAYSPAGRSGTIDEFVYLLLSSPEGSVLKIPVSGTIPAFPLHLFAVPGHEDTSAVFEKLRHVDSHFPGRYGIEVHDLRKEEEFRALLDFQKQFGGTGVGGPGPFMFLHGKMLQGAPAIIQDLESIHLEGRATGGDPGSLSNGAVDGPAASPVVNGGKTLASADFGMELLPRSVAATPRGREPFTPPAGSGARAEAPAREDKAYPAFWLSSLTIAVMVLAIGQLAVLFSVRGFFKKTAASRRLGASEPQPAKTAAATELSPAKQPETGRAKAHSEV